MKSMEGEDSIVLYSSPEHLNSTSLLANFIAHHHPSIPIIIICSTTSSSSSSAPSITYHQIPAPTLPPNLTKHPVELLFEIPRLSNPDIRTALEEISRRSRIKAFVIDFFCNSAFEVSTSLSIPTYFYDSSGTFGLCVFLYLPTIDENLPVDIGDYNDFIEIPGCPPVFSLDFPRGLFSRQSNSYKHFLCTANNMRKSSGIIVHAFDALDFRAKEAISNGLCIPNAPTPPVYLFGPLISGSGPAEHECLKWLDQQPNKSVIFLCFGRRGFFSGKQLKEIAVGLENSGHRFLWSVRNPPGSSLSDEPDLDEILPEGFQMRTRERGFVIKSWAPQEEVLRHNAVAGFVTHCGRSSVVEAVSFGVPMIAWPIYAEQRMNRVFMVEEMKVALPLEEVDDGFVTAGELEKRVRELMESKSGRTIRQRVNELRISGEKAMHNNGSSVLALEKFIASILKCKRIN